MMAELNYANPGEYWQHRLAHAFDLKGAGFAGLGPRYNAVMYAVRIEALRRLFAESQIDLRGKNVLEIGCGTGFYTAWFNSQPVQSYTGIDITTVSVQRLSQQYPHFQFVQADAAAGTLPLRKTFDLVLVADVLFHIVDDQRFRSVIQNIAHVLSPGGRVVLSDILAAETVQPESHCRWRSYSMYEQTLVSAGLRPLKVKPIFAALHPPAALPNNSLPWRFYLALWRRLLFRIARFTWFDSVAPLLLRAVDTYAMLPTAGLHTPNSKWLLAAPDVS